MSASLDIEVVGLASLLGKLHRLGAADSISDLLSEIGALVEGQTRIRINNDKTDPSGKPWEPWSENYAKTRHGGHSLLKNEGTLLDSIQYEVSGDSVAVGSNMVYAKTHQYGSKKNRIPARPYLGLSAADRDELGELIRDWMQKV